MYRAKISFRQQRRLLLTMTAMALILQWSVMPALTQPQDRTSASAVIHRHFDQLFMADPTLFSGTFYTDRTPPSTEGHPFSGTREWQTGSVTKAGLIYDSLQLRYDICNNEIVCNTLGITPEALQLALNRNTISGFTLGSRRFIPFPTSDPGLSGRFCEILADGANRLLLLQTKKLKILANGTSSFAYETSSRKMFYAGNYVTRYKGLKTLINLYPRLRDPLKDFYRRNRIAFRKEPGTRDIRMVEYCNELLTAGK